MEAGQIADSSASLEEGRYAIKVPSLANDPGLMQVNPEYLNTFCSEQSASTTYQSSPNQAQHYAPNEE